MKNIQIVLNAILSKSIFEYILVNNQLRVLETSSGLKKYLDKEPKGGDDVLDFLPELVGSEEEIREIFVKRYCLYTLEAVFKNEYYINLSIEYCSEDTAIILIHNITAMTLSQQKLLQYSNESTLLYNTLVKVLNNQNALLFVTDNQQIKFANQKFMDYFDIKELQDAKMQGLALYKEFDSKLENYDDLFMRVEERESYLRVNNDTFLLHATRIESDHKLFTLTKVTQLTNKITWDTLTGAYRKSYFNTEFHKVIEAKTPSTLAIFDLDDFKKVNDTYGHQVGDNVLKELAALIKSKIRKDDMFARWGGEEFLLLFTDIHMRESLKRIEDIRKSIELHLFEKIEHLTVSFGVAHFQEGDDAESIFLRADKALYRAKANGKNQVVLGE